MIMTHFYLYIGMHQHQECTHIRCYYQVYQVFFSTMNIKYKFQLSIQSLQGVFTIKYVLVFTKVSGCQSLYGMFMAHLYNQIAKYNE